MKSTRREFIAGSTALFASYGFGCGPKSWEPGFECSYFKDRGSPVRFVYIPEMHLDGEDPPAVDFIDAHIAKFDLLALEGLTGKIDQEQIAMIKLVNEHRTHYKPFRDDLEALVKARASDDVFGIGFAKINARRISPECCDGIPPELIGAPGLRYATHYFGKIPMLGYDDAGILCKYHEIGELEFKAQIARFNKDYPDYASFFKPYAPLSSEAYVQQ